MQLLNFRTKKIILFFKICNSAMSRVNMNKILELIFGLAYNSVYTLLLLFLDQLYTDG